MFFGLLKLDTNATLDSLNFYNSNTFFNYLDIQGDAGRKSYLILHLIDYLFITQFYLFLSLSISKLIQKSDIKSSLTLLSLLPMLSGLMDFVENLLIDFSILYFPKKLIVLGDIAGFATALKMYSLYVVFTLLLVLSIVSLINAVKKGD